jgi:hypothetical protein
LECILVLLGSLVGIGLLSLSLGLNDSLVLFVGEGVLLVLLEGVVNSDLLGVAAVELVAGVSEDVGGISDLLSSEGIFGLALGSLGVVDLVVVDLFGVDGISELSEDVKDSIKGALALDLGFDLHHDGHDGSLVRVVEGELLGEAGSTA